MGNIQCRTETDMLVKWYKLISFNMLLVYFFLIHGKHIRKHHFVSLLDTKIKISMTKRSGKLYFDDYFLWIVSKDLN